MLLIQQRFGGTKEIALLQFQHMYIDISVCNLPEKEDLK